MQYERRYGSKYKELGGYQPASHIAKLMRADIKDAINRGKLPGKMSNYSVRVHNYSMGRSIDITARDLEGMWQQCDGTVPGTEKAYTGGGRTMWVADSCHYYGHENPYFEGHQVLTVEGQRIEKILQGIHNAYNYDGSDVMTDYFDVNFYGSASIESEWERESRLREKARKEARKAS